MHKPRPGSPPGTLRVDPSAPRPSITAIAYGPEGSQELSIADPKELEALTGRWPVLWVNVDGLGDAGVIEQLGHRFNIHQLALEDVLHVHQRAKVEPFEGHLFVVARMVLQGANLQTEQVSLFIGDGWVLTFQEQAGDVFDPVRQRIFKGQGRTRGLGADYLAYSLIDALIDAYFPVLESYAERIEALEDQVLSAADGMTGRQIHEIKRELLMLRRAVWPHREAISALLRDESSFIRSETRVYLRDCYDHIVQLLDIVETYRELASGLLEIYLSAQSNRLNEIMKVLTVFAAVFIPLTLIAGIYGMNFKYMPELEWRWGYPVLLVVMLTIGIGLLVMFKRRGWVGGEERKDR